MKYVVGILYGEVAKQLSGLRFDRYFGVYHKNHELHFTLFSTG
jgi:CRISPR/Cas system-associated endonuclease Cas1